VLTTSLVLLVDWHLVNVWAIKGTPEAVWKLRMGPVGGTALWQLWKDSARHFVDIKSTLSFMPPVFFRQLVMK